MTDPVFKDYFSKQSSEYQHYRPHYPPALFQYLAQLVPAHDMAWDCATGNGQAALGLSRHFAHVIATDASRNQLAHAMPAANIDYRLASAEHSGLADHSIDLITVAQALHWFRQDAFFSEARRVLKQEGVMAAWGYGLLSISADINQIIQHLYTDILGPWWPVERRLVDTGYADIALPFQRIDCPEFTMEARWNLQQLIAYFMTWSALQNCMSATGHNPLQTLLPEFISAWGDASTEKTVRWPLFILLGRQTAGSRD